MRNGVRAWWGIGAASRGLGRLGLRAALLGALAALASTVRGADEAAPRVTVLKAPGGGIQPQAVLDDRGALHLITFEGPPSGGDLVYTRLEPGMEEFTAPVRVNSQPGTADALGTIRGGQLALGRGGRIHVAWNGAAGANTEGAHGHGHEGAPMFYTRSSDDRRAFEPQRDLIRRTSALDGGGTVAADRAGNVYVAWHGRSPDSAPGEMGRRMWVARSSDDGATFAPERPAWPRETGACACCASRALADAHGTLFLLYRTATRGTERDMVLLTSSDQGEHFRGKTLQPWTVSTCPMSSESFAESGSVVLAAWETRGQVSYARLDRQGRVISGPVSPPGRGGNRKHPAVAVNAREEVLLAWAEGTGWQKGGALAWQVFDDADRPTAEKGLLRGGIPVWSLATAVARLDGTFLIIH